MQRLADAVRKACLPALWSQGVKLARAQAVAKAPSSKGETVLRVHAPGFAVAPTVSLFVSDLEWSCDCSSKVDPCAHVAAAVIASAQGLVAGGTSAAEEKAETKLVYRLDLKQDRLMMRRIVVQPDGSEAPLVRSLTTGLQQGKNAQGISPTHDDLRIDRLLGTPPREAIPLDRLADALQALEDGEVTLQGKPISTSGEPLLPRAVVEDAPGGGFVLRIERDPSIQEVVAMGVAKSGGILRPLGETATTGDRLERLPVSRVFARGDEGALVTDVLPEIEKKLTVTILTKRLPRTSKDARPRIAMDLTHQGHTLSVLPVLVYGNPTIARIDGDVLVPTGKTIPVRRREEEREVVRLLRDELNLVPGRRVDFDGADAARFAKKLRAFQRTPEEETDTLLLTRRALTARVEMEGDAFDIVFEVDGETEGPRKRADAAAVMRAWQDGLDLVPLEGGGWIPLPADWLAEHGHRVADLLAARAADKKLPASALPDLGALCDALDTPRPLALEKLTPLLEDFDGIPRAPLPEGLTASLRTYQQHGVDWLSFLREAELGGILADDMGLGKTLQALSVMRGRVLVVCPKSVVYNWAEEIARFRPGMRTSIYQGVKRSLDEKADVTLMTYAVLRMDVDRLAKENWDMIVLDEAQAIKNEGSQTARAAFELRGQFRVALSGTPVENRLEELWSLMHFVNPGLLGGRSHFQERYALPIAGGDKGSARRLRAKIRPFVLRRMKREVIPELPPRTDAVLHVELDETERSVYDAVRVATRKDVTEKLAKGGGVLAALEALLRLRQASCHPSLVPGQHGETSSKIQRLLEALEEATSEGHKALVFSQWTGLLDLVEPHLRAASLAFTRLDGSTRDRARVVGEFQDPGGPPVMLVSLKAGGTGLNLTAADHVFLLDPWWNPAVEDQAADRAHRIGQDRPVMVYRMVAKDTVEERIFALQAKKRAIADVALGDADHAAGITREELLALLD